MTKEEIQKRYNTGYEIFAQLFVLSDVELKAKLQSIIGNKINSINDGLLQKNSNVLKTIYNEKYNKISIEWYDSIEIDAFGIDFKPEHGQRWSLIEFNEHFIL